MMKMNSLSPETNELEDLDNYRAFSGLAVLAFLIALLGLIALKYFTLWPLALLGVVIGGKCLFSFANQSFSVISKLFAVAAVSVGVFVLSYLIVENISLRNRLFESASEVGLRYLNLLKENKIDEAYRLSFDQAKFVEESSNATIGQLLEMTKTHRLGFTNSNGINAVIRRGKDAEWKVLGLSRFEIGEETIVCVDYIDANLPNSKIFTLHLGRQDPIPGFPDEFLWCVVTIDVSR